MRFAIYFAPPPHSPWWEFGTRWLGRDEVTDAARPQPLIDGIDDPRLVALTAAPRRYGFHATLKAPFRLRPPVTPDELVSRVDALAATLAPVRLSPLVPQLLDDFVALVPAMPATGAAVARIEAACVHGLEPLRDPLTAAELAARRAGGLDERADALLHEFGYPHVLDRFRLHFTLTGRVDGETAQRVCAATRAVVAELNVNAPLTLDRLCIFHEPAPMRPLRRMHDVLLGAPA